MTFTHVASVNPGLMKIIERHTAGLQDSVDGSDLYALIARGIRRFARQGPIGPDCFVHLYAELDRYARDPLTLPPMRIKARLLQQHLSSYLPENELSAAVSSIHANPGRRSSPIDVINTSDDPVRLADAATPDTRAETRPASAGTDAVSANDETLEGVLEERDTRSEPPRGQPKALRERYDALLRSEQDAWQAIYGTVKDFNRLKRLWMSSLDDLAHERDALQSELNQTTGRLSSLNDEVTRLRAELDKARSGLDDEIGRSDADDKAADFDVPTAVLSTRPELFRHLRAEIERVKRSGGSLVFAMICVEGLEPLARRYGQAVREAIMESYGEQMLASFRVYDHVAQYDDAAYALLLPDTNKDGATRAIEKMRRRARSTHVNCAEFTFPLPGLTGVLTQYRFGETSAVLLKRVRRTLEAARAESIGQIVFVT